MSQIGLAGVGTLAGGGVLTSVDLLTGQVAWRRWEMEALQGAGVVPVPLAYAPVGVFLMRCEPEGNGAFVTLAPYLTVVFLVGAYVYGLYDPERIEGFADRTHFRGSNDGFYLLHGVTPWCALNVPVQGGWLLVCSRNEKHYVQLSRRHGAAYVRHLLAGMRELRLTSPR